MGGNKPGALSSSYSVATRDDLGDSRQWLWFQKSLLFYGGRIKLLAMKFVCEEIFLNDGAATLLRVKGWTLTWASFCRTLYRTGSFTHIYSTLKLPKAAFDVGKWTGSSPFLSGDFQMWVKEGWRTAEDAGKHKKSIKQTVFCLFFLTACCAVAFWHSKKGHVTNQVVEYGWIY